MLNVLLHQITVCHKTNVFMYACLHKGDQHITCVMTSSWLIGTSSKLWSCLPSSTFGCSLFCGRGGNPAFLSSHEALLWPSPLQWLQCIFTPCLDNFDPALPCTSWGSFLLAFGALLSSLQSFWTPRSQVSDYQTISPSHSDSNDQGLFHRKIHRDVPLLWNQ